MPRAGEKQLPPQRNMQTDQRSTGEHCCDAALPAARTAERWLSSFHVEMDTRPHGHYGELGDIPPNACTHRSPAGKPFWHTENASVNSQCWRSLSLPALALLPALLQVVRRRFLSTFPSSQL